MTFRDQAARHLQALRQDRQRSEDRLAAYIKPWDELRAAVAELDAAVERFQLTKNRADAKAIRAALNQALKLRRACFPPGEPC